MKLRTTLTVSGVVIAVGTFVAMLSFGAGNQQYVSDQFEKLGLLHTMQAFPKSDKDATDTVKATILNDEAIRRLLAIPGVRLVYPFDAFNAMVRYGDSQVSLRTQAVSQEVLKTSWFSSLSAGKRMDSDSSKNALVTSRFLDAFGVKSADSIIGKTIVLTIRRSALDSGIARLLPPDREYIKGRLRELEPDSITNREYLRSQLRKELNHTISEIVDGLLNHREMVTESLVVVGVVRGGGPHERLMSPVFVTPAVAAQLSSGFNLDDPTTLMNSLSTGNLFNTGEVRSDRSYAKVTLDVDPTANQKLIKDSIEAMGFRSFSFADQFAEIKQFFVYFDLGLSVVGLIALITASLGIVNTLVMSVMERRREIGVMKSLGADERDIRKLFLTESGIIGSIGSILGIIVGFAVSRLISFVAQIYMHKQGFDPIDLFLLPVWLIFVALLLGTTVSIVAGLYPAARAARVDPVEALRSE